jgi:hypothetical protein
VEIVSDTYYAELGSILSNAQSEGDILTAVVNAPFHNMLTAATMGLGIVVLLLVNPKTKTIDRVALSDTEGAKGAVRMSSKPFHAIKIPVDDERNIIAKAIREKTYQQTIDWSPLFVPALSAREAGLNQAGAGIECSVVYPLVGPGHGGALIFSFHDPPEALAPEHYTFMQTYADLAAKHLQRIVRSPGRIIQG